MPLQLIPWVGIVLEGTLLYRGLRTGLFSRFPAFYAYVSSVLLIDLLRMYVSGFMSEDRYYSFYWITQFVSLLAGSVVLFEIYRTALRQFSGTARLARNLLLAVFTGIIISVIWSSSFSVPEWWNGMYVLLERDLRILQATSIVILLLVSAIYSIPFGRNLRGVLSGYGLYVAMSVIQLALLWKFWEKAEPVWKYTTPISYAGVLLIWILALWSRAAEPKPALPKLEQDYQALVTSTEEMLDRARARLGWAART